VFQSLTFDILQLKQVDELANAGTLFHMVKLLTQVVIFDIFQVILVSAINILSLYVLATLQLYSANNLYFTQGVIAQKLTSTCQFTVSNLAKQFQVQVFIQNQ
jgi:hypothetical protein